MVVSARSKVSRAGSVLQTDSANGGSVCAVGRIASIDDWRAVARARLPKSLFDYVDAGSNDELSLCRNRQELDETTLSQRVLVDVSNRSTSTTVLGRTVDMPVALAPVGLNGLMYPDGEIYACRAAEACGVPYCLSTLSICSIEQVAAVANNPLWFQVYMMKDRGFVRALVERARSAGCDTLIVTVDLPVAARRRRDVRNGISIPVQIRGSHVIDCIRRFRWWTRMCSRSASSLGNIDGHVDGVTGLADALEWTAGQYDPGVTLDDIEWMRNIWNGNLVVKGVLHADDAAAVAQAGADGLIVSNHGGRQLDGAASPISMVPRIVDRVGNAVTVLADGGVRSGLDVLKYLEAGAKTVLIGRAFVYGLSVSGEAGVRKVLNTIHDELDTGMALTGKCAIES